MFLKLFYQLKLRVAPVTGAIVLAVVAPLAFVASPALAAGSGNQWCISNGTYTYLITCANAWSGGPAVDSYDASSLNNDFTLIEAPGTSNWALEDTDGGAYSGYCLGDYGNSSSDARAGLVACPNVNTGSTGGWGSNFHLYSCEGSNGYSGYYFYNNHWGEYLSPSGSWDNGDAMYLNTVDYGGLCFSQMPKY